MTVLVHFVNSEWIIQQQLLHMQMLSKSMTGEEIARVLITVLSTTYSIESEHILAAMRDRASTNNVAISTLNILYPKLINISCFSHTISHTIDHVGERFKLQSSLNLCPIQFEHFSQSPKARLLWKEQMGKPMPTYSTTCWWSK